GYLHRALIARQFETVAPGKCTWAAFLISTILFAIMHERWLSAPIAGAVYAIVMYRTNRVSDAIVAHAASNALIAAWAIIWGQWSLLCSLSQASGLCASSSQHPSPPDFPVLFRLAQPASNLVQQCRAK